MSRIPFPELLWLVAAMALTQGNGCTLIGLGIGAAVDARTPHQPRIMILPGGKVETVQPGTPMTLSLRDSSRVSGTYVRLEQEPAQDYAHRYAQSRAQQPEGKRLPLLGEWITIASTSGKQAHYEFEGFDYRRRWPSSGANLHVLGRRASTAKLDAVELRTVSQVTNIQGAVLDGATISQMFSEGRLPVVSVIVLKQEGAEGRVAIDQVAAIAVPVKKQGKRTGAQIGATVDGTVVAVVVFVGAMFLVLRVVGSVIGIYFGGIEVEQ